MITMKIHIVLLALWLIYTIVSVIFFLVYFEESSHEFNTTPKEVTKAKKKRNKLLNEKRSFYVALGFDDYTAYLKAQDDLSKEAEETLSIIQNEV